MNNKSLDPNDWEALRADAHKLLDQALDKLENASEGPVWIPVPDKLKSELQAALPRKGLGTGQVADRLAALLPYGVGNTHPRFFGWVHGSGSAGGVLPEIAAAAMNANLGGRDHGAIYVEKQVLAWCREMMGFPADSGGLIVSGTSIATLIALKVARDRITDYGARATGVGNLHAVGYASQQTHSCVAQAFDILGLGADALRMVPCDADFRMNLSALSEMIETDRAAGLTPLVVVGTAGAVNVGTIDDLTGIADICAEQNIWFHVDGAFGATAILAPGIAPRLAGLERADSLAFDFHKWLHVNYAAGCVLVRSHDAHFKTFSERPDYLAPAARGLAAGNPWPVDYGPELSRGFTALKIWAHLLEHGTVALGAAIERNCAQAAHLGALVEKHPDFELLAPVTLNIICFRFAPADTGNLDALNDEIVIALQETGIAAPSTKRIGGQLAIRVNITNHRTRFTDLDLLITQAQRLGRQLMA